MSTSIGKKRSPCEADQGRSVACAFATDTWFICYNTVNSPSLITVPTLKPRAVLHRFLWIFSSHNGSIGALNDPASF